MHFICGLCNGNSSAAEREYTVIGSLNPSIVYKCLWGCISVWYNLDMCTRSGVKWVQQEWMCTLKSKVLERVIEDPEIISKKLASETGVSTTTVLAVLHKN